MHHLFAALACAALLAGCASSFDPWSGAPRRVGPAGGPSVVSAPPMVAGPTGCSAPISEFLQVIDNDTQTGHLNPGVYNRISSDLGTVKTSCAEGREADARNQLAALKKRYGYR